MSDTLPRIQDSEVTAAIHRAVVCACAELDKTFPRQQNGGVDSRFAMVLQQSIEQMLTGKVPEFKRKVGLNQLAVSDWPFPVRS